MGIDICSIGKIVALGVFTFCVQVRVILFERCRDEYLLWAVERHRFVVVGHAVRN